MKTCEKMIKRGAMTEARKCLRRVGHSGKCSPDLTGMKFGLNTVQKLTTNHTRPGSSHVRWIVEQHGDTKPVFAYALINSINKGKNWKCGYALAQDGKTQPEYRTVANHWQVIFKSKAPRHQNYRTMPFCDAWNPDKGGAHWVGAKWILDNLGPKPGLEWSLDIIKHKRGFVPGNLRWAKRNGQTRNQIHRKLGSFTVKELKIEARRHGYVLKKIRE